MGRRYLEERDEATGRYVLYRGTEEQHDDCERFPFEAIPRRVFLDTNVVNVLVKWSEEVFEQQPLPDDFEYTLGSDVEALMHVFYVGSRAHWDIVASAKTLSELSETRDAALREALLDYGTMLVDYGSLGRRDEPEHAEAADLARRLVDSPFVAALPDRADRELIAHAIAFDCDAFCTCDRRSIHSKRDKLRQIPLRILTPAEWWQHIKPWAALWC